MKYSFSRPARWDLEGIRRYLAPAPKHIQSRILAELEAGSFQAVKFPLTGRDEPIFTSPASGPVRSILVYPYRIFSRVETEPRIIVAILHGAQDIPSILSQRAAKRP